MPLPSYRTTDAIHIERRSGDHHPAPSAALSLFLRPSLSKILWLHARWWSMNVCVGVSLLRPLLTPTIPRTPAHLSVRRFEMQCDLTRRRSPLLPCISGAARAPRMQLLLRSSWTRRTGRIHSLRTLRPWSRYLPPSSSRRVRSARSEYRFPDHISPEKIFKDRVTWSTRRSQCYPRPIQTTAYADAQRPSFPHDRRAPSSAKNPSTVCGATATF